MTRPISAIPTWSSRTAFILAAAGAAVGLGNIWRFPYLAGVSGGGAFVLVYIAIVVLVAVPILTGEFLIGRRGHRSPARAMRAVAREAGASQYWGWVGGLGVMVGFLVLTFYSVVAGWAVAHVIATPTGVFNGATAEFTQHHFDRLMARPAELIVWHTVFMVLTVAIVMRKLQSGIERTVKVMMPTLFVMLLIMIAYSAVAGDFTSGLRFMFTPDFKKIDGAVVLAAIGQAFFSMGVAMGAMMVYGAYIPKNVSIARSAFVIAATDTMVALLAGIAIFPLVFANGLSPAEGPGLIFVTLPIAFGNMPGGQIFGTLFFLLLTFAALTSSISILEPIVAWLQEKTQASRARVAAFSGIAAWLLGLVTVFSFNIWSDVRLLSSFPTFTDKTIYDLLDYVVSNLMMPIGGLAISIFVGWKMSRSAVLDELGVTGGVAFGIWRLLVRVVAPIAILAILIANLR